MSDRAGRVADDWYRVAHDEHSGACRIGKRVAGVGAAAALLGELVLGGHLRIHRGGVYPLPSVAPRDGLLRDVLHLVGDPGQGRDVGAWLAFLSLEAVTDVRTRMLRDGLLIRAPGSRLGRLRPGRRPVAYVPTDLNAAAWPAIRLAGRLSRREPVPATDALLAGLVQATGLLGHVLWHPGDHAAGWEYADAVRAALPPDLAELVAHTDAAVAERVLTGRSRSP